MKLILAIIALNLPSCATNDMGRTRFGWWMMTHDWLRATRTPPRETP